MAKIGDSTPGGELIDKTSASRSCKLSSSDKDGHGEKPRLERDDFADRPQTVRLLGKDLSAAKAQNIRPPSSLGEKNKENRLSRMHVMSLFSGIGISNRPPSLLEQGLLPGFRNRENLSGSSASSQLTIFYGGTVHVYDNIPFDKAQAIMLLAGESASPKPSFIPPVHETEKRSTHLPQPNLPSICKLEVDLPIARKNSLRCFLEKRHNRIASKTPYAAKPALSKEIQSIPRDDEAQSANNNSSLSPFPSRLGYFSPVSTNNKGS